ncbi:hypothetical protein VTI74DRAFT_1875 [Chaetomium olivicolor]
MGADNETVMPAWGALPVEQYLIVKSLPGLTAPCRPATHPQPRPSRKWDYSSKLSADKQREELVAAYIEKDVLDPELLASPPTRIPTAAEIAEILSPWRPQKLRRMAAALLAGSREHYYFLRTWLELDMEGPDIFPENEWFCVLDDAELFNFGDAWQDVYDVLPELAAPDADRRFTNEHVEWARSTATDLIESEPHVHGEEHYEDAIMQIATIGEPPWLIVLDEEAFETEELGLILRDKKGNPVKETVITPNELGAFYMADARGASYSGGYWRHAAVGRQYQTRGEIMRKLLPLVKGE